jgi:hypothetical protein
VAPTLKLRGNFIFSDHAMKRPAFVEKHYDQSDSESEDDDDDFDFSIGELGKRPRLRRSRSNFFLEFRREGSLCVKEEGLINTSKIKRKDSIHTFSPRQSSEMMLEGQARIHKVNQSSSSLSNSDESTTFTERSDLTNSSTFNCAPNHADEFTYVCSELSCYLEPLYLATYTYHSFIPLIPIEDPKSCGSYRFHTSSDAASDLSCYKTLPQPERFQGQNMRRNCLITCFVEIYVAFQTRHRVFDPGGTRHFSKAAQ